jgi:hypothetical protein
MAILVQIKMLPINESIKKKPFFISQPVTYQKVPDYIYGAFAFRLKPSSHDRGHGKNLSINEH